MNYNYHQDLNIVRVNTMSNRAYNIPCAPSKNTTSKENNERVLLLNGSWKFTYYPSGIKSATKKNVWSTSAKMTEFPKGSSDIC